MSSVTIYAPRAPSAEVGPGARRSMCAQTSPEVATTGTGRGRGNPVNAKPVPVVPTVPEQNKTPAKVRTKICARDVLERAAILEFCEGLPRENADALALAQFGCTTWEVLSPTDDVCGAASSSDGGLA